MGKLSDQPIDTIIEQKYGTQGVAVKELWQHLDLAALGDRLNIFGSSVHSREEVLGAARAEIDKGHPAQLSTLYLAIADLLPDKIDQTNPHFKDAVQMLVGKIDHDGDGIITAGELEQFRHGLPDLPAEFKAIIKADMGPVR